jgi:hypothetical protein
MLNKFIIQRDDFSLTTREQDCRELTCIELNEKHEKYENSIKETTLTIYLPITDNRCGGHGIFTKEKEELLIKAIKEFLPFGVEINIKIQKEFWYYLHEQSCESIVLTIEYESLLIRGEVVSWLCLLTRVILNEDLKHTNKTSGRMVIERFTELINEESATSKYNCESYGHIMYSFYKKIKELCFRNTDYRYSHRGPICYYKMVYGDE